ncbi:SUKH-3 domain-containing protein [Micromonospora sp. NPDC049366]|uniref:SUKH-3 domain-containing protein n=1 Tax=Micromonospora sp. NPDC049366 TaxID=3364271 RepID=UPI0037BB2F57
MSAEVSGIRPEGLMLVLQQALRSDVGKIYLQKASGEYAAAGYEVTPWLRSFLERYSELVVAWRTARGGEVELDTRVEAALDAYPHNVRVWGRRLGMSVVPVGMAFETEERLLLAEDGEILIAGDGGIQRVGRGFENCLAALISGAWNKRFF